MWRVRRWRRAGADAFPTLPAIGSDPEARDLATSRDLLDRAAAGAHLGRADDLDAASDVLAALLVDPDSTFVIDETARALCDRPGAGGLRLVAAAYMRVPEDNSASWIYDAVFRSGAPPVEEERRRRVLRDLTDDPDPDVADGAKNLLGEPVT